MTKKSDEVLVRELYKLISDLADKVVSLEGKISEQNALIANHIGATNLQKTQVEGKQASSTRTPSAASAQAQPALQRPIRQARLTASANIAAGSSAAAAKKLSTGKDKVRQSTSGSVSPKCDRAKKDVPKSTATTDDATIPSSRATMTPVSTMDNVDANDQGEWLEVSRKRRPTKQRRILTGSGTTFDDGLQPAERLKFIQAWSFRPETTAENVRKHINNIAVCEKYVVEKRDIKTSLHAAFVIGFPETLYDRLCTPNAWPPGIKISDWFRLAPRHSERGSLATAVAVDRLSH